VKLNVQIVLFALLFQLTPVYAATPFERDVETMRSIYLKATDGDKRAVRKAIRTTTKLEHKYRGHPLALAYKGGALALRGINIGKRPLDRMRETEEGLNLLDKALRKLPRHTGPATEIIETMLVSAYVFINLPDSIFHRLKEGDHLVQQLLKHPAFAEQPRGLQAAIYFAAATSAEKFNDMQKFHHYLELTTKTDPNGLNGKEANTRLKEMDD